MAEPSVVAKVIRDTNEELGRVGALIKFVDLMTKQHATDYADAINTMCGAMLMLCGRAPTPEALVPMLDICAATIHSARSRVLERMGMLGPAAPSTNVAVFTADVSALNTSITALACPACNGPCFAPADSHAERVDCVECDARLITRRALCGTVVLESIP
jgi:hypothetical protein